jgi:Na+/proline symporter
VTVIAVVGILPYISLQLKAISTSYAILLQYPEISMPASAAAGKLELAADTAFWVAMILAAFTILFGTPPSGRRRAHEGMVAAIAFESIVKLLAFLAVGPVRHLRHVRRRRRHLRPRAPPSRALADAGAARGRRRAATRAGSG